MVIQGAGMNMRGKVDIELFGRMTLEELNEQIRGYATELGLEAEFCHSNVEGELVNALYTAHDGDIDAAIINPAGHMTSTGPLRTAIRQVRFPVFEVHYSNPVARGIASTVLPNCRGSVTGFGPFGYYLALRGVKELMKS